MPWRLVVCDFAFCTYLVLHAMRANCNSTFWFTQAFRARISRAGGILVNASIVHDVELVREAIVDRDIPGI
jgi:hypothetical protein